MAFNSRDRFDDDSLFEGEAIDFGDELGDGDLDLDRNFDKFEAEGFDDDFLDDDDPFGEESEDDDEDDFDDELVDDTILKLGKLSDSELRKLIKSGKIDEMLGLDDLGL